MDNLRLAYHKARKGKARMHNVRRFERDVEGNLRRVQQLLLMKTFTTAQYQVKTIYEPKQRNIYVLPFFPDRIVQHALMNVLGPIWEGLFIADSYACLTGRGVHSGSRKTMELVRRYRYCLKADIHKFYPSVNHDILFAIIKHKIKCPDTLWLLHNIIYSYPGGKNVPIGNYTSQWFGNLYMNELDQLIKHKYKVRGYLRYCDDFCLFHDDKRFLRGMAHTIEEFLLCHLQLHYSKCDVFPVSQGVDFLGYRHFRGYILLRKSTAKRVTKRLRKLPTLLFAGKITHEQFRGSVASTHGWLKWANTHNLSLSIQLQKLQEMAIAR